MRNMIHTSEITEGKAATAIFNACRDNEKRENKGGVNCAGVTFLQFASGNEFEATLHNAEGIVIAIATVDEFDV